MTNKQTAKIRYVIPYFENTQLKYKFRKAN